MNVEGVDPRDIGWGVGTPSYRVHFHDASGAGKEYRLTSGDVDAVLQWAAANARGRSFVLYVEHEDQSGRGLIRLLGADPNEARQRDGHP